MHPELWQMPEPPKVGVAAESLISLLIEDHRNQVICYPQSQCLRTWALQKPNQLVTDANFTETTDSKGQCSLLSLLQPVLPAG